MMPISFAFFRHAPGRQPISSSRYQPDFAAIAIIAAAEAARLSPD